MFLTFNKETVKFTNDRKDNKIMLLSKRSPLLQLK